MELAKLLRLLDQGYGDQHAISECGWDFEKNVSRPPGTGDDLARFVCVEVAANFDAQASSLAQLTQAHADMARAKDDLDALVNSIHEATVKFVLSSFWAWFRKSGRRTYTPSLLQSWCDVHDDQVVRDLYHLVQAGLNAIVPKGPLTDEIFSQLDLVIFGDLVANPMAPPPPPPPPAPTPPTPTT